MSYLPPAAETSNESQGPAKNRREILCSRKDERNADLRTDVMEIFQLESRNRGDQVPGFPHHYILIHETEQLKVTYLGCLSNSRA